MSNELIINASLPETRIALMENGEIQELLIERASGKGIVGNIYKGKVTRVLPGMQAAFVDIGLEKAAFLYVDDVYVHSEVWEEDEEPHQNRPSIIVGSESGVDPQIDGVEKGIHDKGLVIKANPIEPVSKIIPIDTSASELSQGLQGAPEFDENQEAAEWSNEVENESEEDDLHEHLNDDENDLDVESDPESDSEDDEEGDEGGNPVEMGADSSDDDRQPEGTVAPPPVEVQSSESPIVPKSANEPKSSGDPANEDPRRRPRRGRRGGRFRRKPSNPDAVVGAPSPVQIQTKYPETYHDQVEDAGNLDSDRAGVGGEQTSELKIIEDLEAGRPEIPHPDLSVTERRALSATGERGEVKPDHKPEFRAQRSRDRRIRQSNKARPVKVQVNIQDLLKEGQEVLVQVAKDPIATKGARLTCHISLPGRHLVCMPTIDHVGVSRRIDREDERRRLREYVERNRPKNLGFIVRTASGKQQSEKRIKQDIEYLTRLWTEIREKAGTVTAPALVYEDLNSVLRAIRDWVTEEIDKVVVDSRYHFNEIQRFVSHFMPPLKQKVELYHGDIPIFDAYGISTELSRALERKVWLKSGGYIVVDQAEALVAIDVNTGRYVGKKNLEDTILKTNLEAVQEIAYQLRLRNCGGIIILDLIDMEKDENKQRVYRALEDALSRDRARPTILKISELGLVEMTRKRTRDTIIRTLCESCTHCEGKGFIKSKQTVAYEVMREVEREGIEREVSKILVQAHPDVIDILAIDERETLDQLERKYRKLIYLQSMADFHPEQFEVSAEKRERVDRGRENQGRDNDHNSDRNRNRNRNRNDSSSNHAEGSPIIPVARGEVLISPIQPIQSPQSVSEVSDDPAVLVVSPIVPISPVIHPVASLGSPGSNENQDGFSDEEDRLAFLRAQAAQDAALARLGNPAGNNAQTIRSAPDAPNRGDRNQRRNTRGRRGPGGSPGNGNGSSGKFRRGGGFDRQRPKPFGYSPPAKWTEGGKEPSPAPSSAEPSTGDAGTASDSAKNNNGGDRSQPPS